MNIENFEMASALVDRIRLLEVHKEHTSKNIDDFLYHLSEESAEKIKTIVLIDLDTQISAAKAELEGL